MRDWTLVVAPVAAVLYFLFEPGKFGDLLGFLARVIH